jgi:lipoprotein-anchoring transpeptidase ErfK/SrfK
MRSAHQFRLAASALALTLVFSASSKAEPLAMNDPNPFAGSIFDQIFHDQDPAPQANTYQAVPQDSVQDEAPATVQQERFRRQIVAYTGSEAPGTVIIDTPHTYLYYVLGQGRAIRYGIGVGRDGFRWAGVQTVARKQEWPDWHPPAAMISRQPYLPRFMAGGPANPLGARAMYLGNTEYRIHGTNAPETIGTRVSSGCIRLINADVEDLYDRVQVGAKVVVLPDNSYRAERIEAAPAQHISERARQSYASVPRPVAAVPSAPRDTLAYGSSGARLY